VSWNIANQARGLDVEDIYVCIFNVILFALAIAVHSQLMVFNVCVQPLADIQSLHVIKDDVLVHQSLANCVALLFLKS
jgi:hypothetical protein